MTGNEGVQDTADRQFYKNDEIDLRDIFSILWAGNWLVLAFISVFAVAGGAYAFLKPNIYQASVLLAPSNDEGGAGGINGQLGGLASLAGINLGGSGANQTVIAKEILQSRAFLSDFILRRNLDAPLMGTKAWSKEDQAWVYNNEVYSPETGDWLADDQGTSHKPSDWDLVKRFKEKNLSVIENKENSMITVSVKSMSPIAAQRWAEWLVADINDRMRRQEVAKANARIEYLEGKLNETNVAGMQQVFYQLIESEMRTVMLANAQQEYVFETVDPAVIPQEKSEPKRALIIVMSIVLGAVLGILAVFLRFFLIGTGKTA